MSEVSFATCVQSIHEKFGNQAPKIFELLSKAADKNRVPPVLAVLEKLWFNHLNYQHPEIRGNVEGFGQEISRAIGEIEKILMFRTLRDMRQTCTVKVRIDGTVYLADLMFAGQHPFGVNEKPIGDRVYLMTSDSVAEGATKLAPGGWFPIDSVEFIDTVDWKGETPGRHQSLIWLCFTVPLVGQNLLWGNYDKKLRWKKFCSDISVNLITYLAIVFVFSFVV